MLPIPSDSIAQNAKAMVERLQKEGFQAFWVGGCVRDFLLGRTPGDYDIVTSALPDQIEKVFPRTIPVGRKFGVIIVIADGHEFQIATFRAEADYQDGRRPEVVVFGDAKADAERRDFTVNGLFFDPIKRELRDWVGGEIDLRAKLIRTIGKPEDRFAEDHLRMLRAVRLAAQLDFQIDPATVAALKALAAKIKGVSAERIRDELIKIFSPPHAARGLDLLRESGLLEHVLPELIPTITCDQSPDFHPEGSVYNHIRLMLSQLPKEAPLELPWAALLHDVAKPATASLDAANGRIHFYGHERVGAEIALQLLERLRFPRKQIDDIVHAVRCHMQFKDAPNMRKSTLRQLLMRPTFPLELALHRLDCLGSHRQLDIYDFLLEQEKELSKKPEIRPSLVNGDDLIALGFKPGPALGTVLAEIRELQLEEELKTADQAREWAKKKLEEKGNA
jgi:tRNA nucleotidyltransferase/poly(A) polymerase